MVFHSCRCGIFIDSRLYFMDLDKLSSKNTLFFYSLDDKMSNFGMHHYRFVGDLFERKLDLKKKLLRKEILISN